MIVFVLVVHITYRRRQMNINFNTSGYLEQGNFRPENASKLFRKIWDWCESFYLLICNDKNIEIENILVQREGRDLFNERLTITIRGVAYGFPIEEKVHFSLKEILSPKKPKKSFSDYMTERFAEKLERIKYTIDEQHAMIEETMSGLRST